MRPPNPCRRRANHGSELVRGEEERGTAAQRLTVVHEPAVCREEKEQGEWGPPSLCPNHSSHEDNWPIRRNMRPKGIICSNQVRGSGQRAPHPDHPIRSEKLGAVHTHAHHPGGPALLPVPAPRATRPMTSSPSVPRAPPPFAARPGRPGCTNTASFHGGLGSCFTRAVKRSTVNKGGLCDLPLRRPPLLYCSGALVSPARGLRSAPACAPGTRGRETKDQALVALGVTTPRALVSPDDF